MRILGIDPGYDRLGIAILDKSGTNGVFVYSECFTTKTVLPFPQRLALVQERIEKIIADFNPTILAIETLYFSVNKKTAISVAEARGVILSTAARSKLSIHEFAPGTIKVAVTGHGAATKEAVMKMVPMLTSLPEKRTSDDELDAIAVALTAAATLR